ncbi:EAL domain-containing protein [Thioalbus denitrificans]|uniref:cyclic-guanylate-specific phosphodiesterase n=1 Tax=Thioalbus denitrificans TaxID=547122 RepID=A0A369C8C5_9GAMM|nr:EAL domain-containing protein [Thioalbus denitrificans]RCX28054.1 PAS domain S-box-containing protein/diguanylate cyclase (GGDEF)-like protein [Thioalbus denitrificans]
MRGGLFRRYAIPFLALIAGVAAAITTAHLLLLGQAMHSASQSSAEALEKALYAQLEQRGRLLAGFLADDLVNSVYNYDMATIQETLVTVTGQPDVAHALIYDTDGQMLHDGRQGIPGFSRPVDSPLDDLRAGEMRLRRLAETLEVDAPILLGERPLGAVRLVLSLEGIRAGIDASRSRIDAVADASFYRDIVATALISLVLMAVGGGLALWVTRRLVRPIRQLAQSADRVGKGDYNIEVDSRRDDELGDLARSFQAMGRNLAHTTISKQYLDNIIGSMENALLVSTPEGRVTLVNRALCVLLGQAEKDLIGSQVTDLAPEVPPQRLLSEGIINGLETWLTSRGGRPIPVSLSGSVMHENGTVRGLVLVAQDITERKQAEEQLRLASSVFANTSEGIVIIDERGVIRMVNGAFAQLVGRSPAQLNDKVFGEFLVDAIGGREDPVGEIVEAVVRKGQWEGEISVQRGDGTRAPQWLTVSAVRDDAGALSQCACILLDLTELRDAEERVRHLAYFDTITGLPNRTLFQDRLEHALAHANREGHRLAVLFLDLDRFKSVNDTLGHAMGDQLLAAVARGLSRSLRAEDTVARLGGDEFAVIVDNIAQAEDVAQVAAKVMEIFGRPFQVTGHDLFTSASIGISVYPDDARDGEGLLRNADTAMYRAKERGRNSYQFFTSDMNARALEHMALEHGMRRALERDEFRLAYQPIVDLETREPVGMEALVRWTHPQLGEVPPGRFIPVAEDCGLIGRLGEWVLTEACRQLSAWRREGITVQRLAVNISSRQFYDPQLVDRIQDILASSGIAPTDLSLELTERTLIDDVEGSTGILTRLHELGLEIALDDFGTGYSALGFLKRFPIQLLKVDASFVNDIALDDDDAALVEGIVTLAHNLGLKVVAEGVENLDQVHLLAGYGCDYAQGYFFARPLSAQQMTDVLLQGQGLSARKFNRDRAGT